MKELFSSTSGNPDLDPMKSTGFELGFDYRFSNQLSFNLVGFHNNIRDLIDRAKKYDPYLNIDKAIFKGIEAQLNWEWQPFNHLYLSYTHLKAEDKTSADNTYIQYRPKHKIDAGLSMRLPALISVQLNASYVSEQIYYDDDQEFSLDDYTLFDIKLSKNFSDRFELYLTVRNLFDVDYFESEGYPREGRQIYGGIRVKVW